MASDVSEPVYVTDAVPPLRRTCRASPAGGALRTGLAWKAKSSLPTRPAPSTLPPGVGATTNEPTSAGPAYLALLTLAITARLPNDRLLVEHVAVPLPGVVPDTGALQSTPPPTWVNVTWRVAAPMPMPPSACSATSAVSCTTDDVPPVVVTRAPLNVVVTCSLATVNASASDEDK